MPIPSPKERPDLYDAYDGRPSAPSDGEKAYWDSLLPEEMKAKMSEKKPAEPGAEPAPEAPAEKPAE